MKDKIEVGEYIRTDKGVIGKVKRIELDEIDKSLKWYVFDKKRYDMNIIDEVYINKPYIKKHSFNIIDLIEEGDYVNDKEIIMNLEKSKKWYNSEDDFVTAKAYTYNEDEIKSIVTKEQFKNVEYKI